MHTLAHIRKFRKTRLILAYLFAACVLGLPLFFSFYVVRGDSMAPAYKNGQVLLADRFSLRFWQLRRGEVVIMRNPHAQAEIITKRIIGLPNESVRVDQHDVVIIHFDGTDEQFGEDTLIGAGSAGDNAMRYEMKLGPEDYFVLGDNRQTSLDSRIFGAVQPQDVIGRVVWKTPVLLK